MVQQEEEINMGLCIAGFATGLLSKANVEAVKNKFAKEEQEEIENYATKMGYRI